MKEGHDIRRRDLLKVIAAMPVLALLKPGTSWAYDNVVRVRTDERYRYLYSNAIPNHPTGRFPNRGNPFAIEPQQLSFRMPLRPERGDGILWMERNGFGVAVNGIPFNPLTDFYWNNERGSPWRAELLTGFFRAGLDFNNAHCMPGGLYHYHGLPMGLLELLRKRGGHSPLIGWAADGFPIYASYGYENPGDPGSRIRPLRASYRIKSGMRPPGGPGGRYDGQYGGDWEYVSGLGDLDAVNGREAVTPEYPQGIYAYYLTAEFPFVPRGFVGIPDPSFQLHLRPGAFPPGRRPPPQGAPRRPWFERPG